MFNHWGLFFTHENCKIIPIFKSGDSSDLKNYRPISLLPSFSKVFEKLIFSRLIAFFVKRKVLNTSQHGFRSGYSTNTALADVLNTVTAALDSNYFLCHYFLISRKRSTHLITQFFCINYPVMGYEVLL